MQPLLRAIGPVPNVLNILLEILYPVLGGSQLKRQLASNPQCVLAAFFRHAGSPLKQAQDALPGAVYRIATVGNWAWARWGRRDDGFRRA